MPVVVEAEGVHLSFGTTPALRGIDLRVGGGESVAVVGSSGSGKSTLLHCLTGLRRPDEGRITFEGRDLDRAHERARSSLRLLRMGIVFQFGELLPELTVAENVGLPLWVAGTSRSASNDAALAVLGPLGIEALADRHPGDVSGGERQRAAIARALVHRPPVLFADEPTGSLDSKNAENVMAILLGVAKEQGTTVVLVTHERRFADRCDRTVNLRDGRVVEP